MLDHEGIPQFEINEVNLQILHDIMIKNEAQEQTVSAWIADSKLKTEEYCSERKELQQLHV